MAEASSRRSRLARFHQKAVELAADKEGEIKEVEQFSRDAISAFKNRLRPGDAQAGVGTPSDVPAIRPRVDSSQHPVADALLAVAGVTLAARVSAQKIKELRERKRRRGDQAGDG
ncbi:hypothetical protein AB0J86_37270 [Micromonospora sp. NPDC049559]|uniref:hypothetical protein n=1 Tax=Micromonospora sp. NPDC049559 TaxID=3155923 RepID=UPI003429990C